jgi:transposase-like protein
MGWSEVSIMSGRREFVSLAKQEGANVRELCRRYGISPTTGYKWIERSAADAEERYEDRSRRLRDRRTRRQRRWWRRSWR